MPTIKRKVEMNLPQLIEWAQDNIEEATKKVYRVNENEVIGDHVRFTEVYSDLQVRLHGYIPFDTTFTVGVEEEITEETVIPKLLTTFKKTYLKYDFGYQRVRIDEDYKVQLMLNKAESHREEIETLHMVNDDGTHTLLWRDGRLIE